MNENKIDPETKNNNVIGNEALEQKRKDATVEFKSVGDIFDELLKHEGVFN